MSAPLPFRVLGPLEISQDGRPVPVKAGKQRAVLATLLLRAGRTVSMPELVDKLWDGVAPADARGTVQKYVMRLRRVLAGTGGVILTEPDGYRIELPPDGLDLHRCNGLIEQGTRAAEAGDPVTASARLTEALELWRGVPPLSNVASETLHRVEVPRLVERYLQALELRIEVDLRLGRHTELCEELIGLVRAHPLRERFWAQRMRALYAAERQGEALEAYREVTRLLADELGIDPGPELRAAHEDILRRSDATPPVPVSAFTSVVRQLPMAAAGVVGRQAEIDRITTLWSTQGAEGDPQLVVVTGPAGVGKTTVAVHAAHRLAARFPDGQLFADLREFADAPAVSIEDTLTQFLRALDVPPGAVPQQADAAAALFRSLTAGRRLLVVLDDASSPAQVRALLPGSATCGVLVTSRRELAGLLASPGGVRIPLGMLTATDSTEALRRILGEERMAADQDGAAELVALCAGLPLALRVAAAGLSARPHLSISAYVEQLTAGDPLCGLRVEGDGQIAVSTAVAASYRLLGAEQRRLLRLASLVPATRITAAEVAAVAQLDVLDTAAGLDQLAAAGILGRRPDGRFELHDLTRAFAAQRLAVEGAWTGHQNPGPHSAAPAGGAAAGAPSAYLSAPRASSTAGPGHQGAPEIGAEASTFSPVTTVEQSSSIVHFAPPADLTLCNKEIT